MKSVLIVDDERTIRESLQMILEYEGYSTAFAQSGEEALKLAAQNEYGCVVLDVKMGGIDGLETLRQLKMISPDVPVLMISGHATMQTAVEAARLGAFDFLPKPLDRDKVVITIRNATQSTLLVRRYRAAMEQTEERYRILGSSPAITAMNELIERAAPTDTRVLITGENGSGKELVARALHRLSRRKDGPFVEVNCAAIPSELIESELFGHEKGAFTGATGARAGKFELADGGTLFLDEVGDMSLNAQAKVLRAVEDGTFQRLGSTQNRRTDVRIVAATNKNLEEEINAGRFREDLYHRLRVIPIAVPPLRDHSEDIPILAQAFLDEVCARNGLPRKGLSERVIAEFQSREWRGNVRELRNTLERLAIISSGTIINGEHLEPERKPGRGFEELIASSSTWDEFKARSEAAFLRLKLEEFEWNVSATAQALGIQRGHLHAKLKKYGISRKEL